MLPGITQQINISFDFAPTPAVLQMLFVQLIFFTLVFSNLINSNLGVLVVQREGDEEAIGRAVGEDMGNFYITHYTQEEGKGIFFLFLH